MSRSCELSRRCIRIFEKKKNKLFFTSVTKLTLRAFACQANAKLRSRMSDVHSIPVNRAFRRRFARAISGDNGSYNIRDANIFQSNRALKARNKLF